MFEIYTLPDRMEILADFIDLTSFLPWEYKILNDSDYFSSLVNDGVYHNIDRQPIFGSVHLALSAMHMIFMGIVYNYLMIIAKASPAEFNLVLIGFHHLVENKREIGAEISWHDFSIISESSILEFFRSVNMSKADIGKLKAMVKKRNVLMHANGIYIDNIEIFTEYSKTYLDCAKTINKHCFDSSKKLFFEFIKSVEIKLNDKIEAESYISGYFSKEYGISSRAFESLAGIKIEDYPRTKNRKFIYEGLQKYLSNWMVEFN